MQGRKRVEARVVKGATIINECGASASTAVRESNYGSGTLYTENGIRRGNKRIGQGRGYISCSIVVKKLSYTGPRIAFGKPSVLRVHV